MAVESAILFDIFVIIIAAAGVSVIAKMLKQPLILAYVVAGLIIGPYGYRIVTSVDLISTLAEFGIALLLFVVGLELSFNRIKKVGYVASLSGLVQVLMIGATGFLVASYLGFVGLEAVYVGMILAFSSTMVVIKLLSDSNELDTLHGRIMLGILLIQDLLVIIALFVLVNVGNFSLWLFGTNFVKGMGLLVLAVFTTKTVLPFIFKHIADSQEVLVLFAVAWAFAFSALAQFLGFSIVIGAFIAGLGLASFPYSFEIINKVKPLRDFFVTIFFVSLGMQIIPDFNMSILIPVLAFLAVVLLLKPFIIMLLISSFRYTQRTAFFSGAGLAQISEFSLILAAQGFMLGHISQDLFSMTIAMAVITMSLSPYIIRYDNRLYRTISRYLIVLRQHNHDRENLEKLPSKFGNHVVLAGCHRMGNVILKTLRDMKKEVIVLDYNPEIIDSLLKQDINAIYGDLSDPDILERVALNKAYLVISTLPEQKANLLIVRRAKERNKHIKVIVAANSTQNALDLYEAGADYVILPKVLSGEKISAILHTSISDRRLGHLKRKHIKNLEKMREEELLETYAPQFIRYIRDGLAKRKKG